jgi:hypothetical protein
MKNMFLILSIFLFITGCSEEETKQQENSIYGTWKLIEIYQGNGGNNPQWTSVDSGYTYTFNNDRIFSSTRFTDCISGTYEVSGNSITLDYSCNGFNTGIETPPGTFVESYIFENANLILTPSYLNCFEGCDYKFEKIEN